MGRLYWSALLLLCSIECGSICREFVEEKGKEFWYTPRVFIHPDLCFSLSFPLSFSTASSHSLIPSATDPPSSLTFPIYYLLFSLLHPEESTAVTPIQNLVFPEQLARLWFVCACVHTCACMGVGLPAYNCRQNISIFMISLCWCIVGVSKCKC